MSWRGFLRQLCFYSMIDIMIPLQSDSSVPIYMQIYNYFKYQMENGVLKSGDKLPSSRQLAEKLGVSRSTTIMAYEQLVAEGYLYSKQGSGYFVCNLAEELMGQNVFREGNKTGVYQSFGVSSVYAPELKEKKHASNRNEIDFSPRGIDLDSFPIQDWRRISKDILNYANKELFSSGNHQGEPELCAILAEYLYSSRGVKCEPEQIVMGAGSEYLLTLLCHLLGENHPVSIAMENPTYKQAYRVISCLGNEVVPVEMDMSGMRVDELAKTDARIAYVMPSHQFPTGIVMPISRRRELLAWAGKQQDRFIIEDDYDSEFRYKGKPIPALQGMDLDDRVIYLGTFSKSVAPAIRISYMVLPKRLVEPFQKVWGFHSSTVSRVDQKILYHFMREGFYERHLNRMRAIYREKHDTMMEALEPFRRYFDVTGENAGLHILLTAKENVLKIIATENQGLPEWEQAEKMLVACAEKKDVVVYPLSEYRIGVKTSSATVILGYATLTIGKIREGIARLEQAWFEKE